MGSPGVFIHSGTLGGRLSAFSLAPSASLAARPPAMTAPPTNAPPSRRNRRRDVAAISLSMSPGSVIVHPPFESGAQNNGMKLSNIAQGRRLDCNSASQPPLAEDCCACFDLADPVPLIGTLPATALT